MSSNSSKHILIVDDDIDTLSLLADLLRTSGYKVDCANNGAQAIAFLRSSLNMPGLILLDLKMPEMNGLEFRREQEKDPRLADVPILLMTADNHIQSKSMRLGAKNYLKKPFESLELILETIDKFFSRA